METRTLILVEDFCINHQIEISFITLLQESELIDIITIEQIAYIDANQLQQLEKLLRYHYELDINIEGIEAISHLLKRTEVMQNEIIQLKNRLRLYEQEEEI